MISLTDIALRRGPRLLLEGVNEQIHGGEKVGMVGDNGSGKSSLFSLMLGQLHQDKGEIRIPPEMVIAHVAQEAPATDQTALDYVLDGDPELRQLERELVDIDHENQVQRAAELYARLDQIDGYGAPSRAARLLHGLGFENNSHEFPIRQFSGGWRVRLSLARALMCRSDLLLLDEPTNHLDLDAVVWLEDWLAGYQGTLLLISHDRDFLDAVCKRILHLENQRVRSYSGNYTRFERTRAESMAAEQAVFRKQQKEVAHLESYITRFKAKATKARQAQSRIKALERMQVVAPAHVHSPFRFSFIEPDRASDPLIKVEDVSAGYQQQPILQGLEFSIGSQERIALVGPNGAGKSTLIKLLAGEMAPIGGHITRAKGLKTGYFAQHQLEQLDPDKTPLTQMQKAFPRSLPQELRNFLGGFGFNGDRVNDKIEPFSGGEKARLALAILIFHGPNLLLMDEPTNHLDLEMRHALTLAFQNYQGAILLVSHDRHLIRTVTDELWLVHGGAVEIFNDDVDGYLSWARQARGTALAAQQDSEGGGATSSNNSSRKARRQEAARLREKIKPLTKEIRSLEQKIEQARSAAMELEKTLLDPATYENESTAKLAELMQKKSRLEKSADQWEQNWYQLSEELESLDREGGV